MNILILGKGAREHALAWKLIQSADVEKCYVAPGNPGIQLENKIIPLNENLSIEQLLTFAKEKDISLTVVGPEDYLVAGVVNAFQKAGLAILGPSQEAAKLEGSKIFSKRFMKENHIATADFRVVSSVEELQELQEELSSWSGFVVKKDGLAAGKGVVVCHNLDDALKAAKTFFNEGEKELLIEERLSGPEVSVFYLCHGEDYEFLGAACDYKRLLDNDEGPNTGGMGCYSPASWLEQTNLKEIEQRALGPTLKAMKQRGEVFNGFLFLGLMMTPRGASVLEYNVRLGDPETQTILPLIRSDLLPYFNAVARGEKLSDLPSLTHESMHSVHIVKASKGYPASPEKGKPIKLRPVEEGSYLFFAGVGQAKNGLETAGGRVCGITSTAKSLAEARAKAYRQLDSVEFEGEQFRKDIALIPNE